ncbi:MAG: ABC transporter permease [Bacteroidales bacterium]
MFSNLLKYSIRALKRQKVYVMINVFGLAIGLAASLMIALFILNELSFDGYHENKDNIYKVILQARLSGQEIKVTSTAPPIGPNMRDEFPEVQEFLRMNAWGETIIKKDDIFFEEDHFIEADSTFFDFFTIPLIRGNKETALSEPFTVVLSESTARKIFGEEEPINKMLKVGSTTELYRVTGVMQDIPDNTHFKANMIGSFISNPRSSELEWLSNSFHTYVMLHPQATAQQVNDRFQDLVIRKVSPEIRQYMGISFDEFLSQGNKYNLFLQPLSQIKVDPTIEGTLVRASDPKYFWIFGGIGMLILVIAAINFMNLSIAQATKRAREVGIKKVSGSSRNLLVGQFLLETIILSILAMIIAMMIVEVAMPWFNQMLDLNLDLQNLRTWYFFPALIIFVIFIGMLAGSYPAFYMSSFNPNEVLKGKTTHSRKHLSLRSGLTILQFSISIILIVSTLLMHRQIRYMLNKDLGFDQEQVLVIRRAEVLGPQVQSFKEELLQQPGIVSVSASTSVPGHTNNNNGYMMRGRPEETFLMQTNWVDYDYLKTYGIELAQGRSFDPEMLTDQQGCLINERAVTNFSIENPFETVIIRGDANEASNLRPVIGVVKDFHFESLRQQITPCIMHFKDSTQNWGYISVRLSPGNPQETISGIEQTWGSFTAKDPLLYFFLDQDLQQLYVQERQNASMSVTFTILAIIIASLGLYGLMAFTVAQRTREIGVRKTFGASATDIWLMISKEIFALIGLATLIAWPIVYWVGSNWLSNYHYRTSMSFSDFLAGLVIASIIAIITISYRIVKTARMNPSISLRYE